MNDTRKAENGYLPLAGGSSPPHRKGDYTIRSMRRNELDLAVGWAAWEGWNPGRHDADCFFQADPTGFLIGHLSGVPVASLSAVKYGDSFGFLGFYIVTPEARGQGCGLEIWNAGMASLAGRNIGLDGVVDQQDNYKKSGFKLAGRNIRFERAGGGDAPADCGLIDLASIPFSVLDDYDRPFFPDKRSAFLQAWVRQPESRALGIQHAGTLCGYGVIRRCQTGYKIGPLFADTAAMAEALFVGLKSTVGEDQRVVLDVPEINDAGIALAERHGMKPMFETARMYNHEIPDMPMQRIYGITSFELG